jgi:dTDP-L-rhamnose 4-epimerase
MKVLLTGAAGFIGTAVAESLAGRGHEVVGIDAWIPQAHTSEWSEAERGVLRVDVRDARALAGLLVGVDVVCHQAAVVGVGVTPADLPLYASHNDFGTAVLLAAMAARGLDHFVLASSMVVYGDGRYMCGEHGIQPAAPRLPDDLASGDFEVGCPMCGSPMQFQLVDEDAPPSPRSGYAASKLAQENYVSAWSRQLPGTAIALRYHNVYGPGMPRDTPYSGVAAIFRSAIERGESPRVFEDGGQMRDFVHVRDVAEANALAVERVVEMPRATFTAYNVCSGQPVTIAEVAALVARQTGRDIMPVTTGEHRPGDVRHIVASPQRAADELGFRARVPPAEGLWEFATAPLRS